MDFNPSRSEKVNALKSLFADIIDICDRERVAASDGELKRLYSVAITEAQTAQMWAVKAVTWGFNAAKLEELKHAG